MDSYQYSLLLEHLQIMTQILGEIRDKLNEED